MHKNTEFENPDINAFNVYVEKKKPEWIHDHPELNFESCVVDALDGIKYFLVEDQFYIESEKLRNFRKNVRQVVNMQGIERSANIMVDFNPKESFLYVHEICIFRQEASIDKLNPADIRVLRREYEAEKNILSGEATLSIVLSDVKINDIIIFSYSIISISPYSVKFFNRLLSLEYGAPVYELYLALIAPKDMALEYKFTHEAHKVDELETEEKRIYVLNKIDIRPKDIQKYVPYWYLQHSCWQVGIKKSWTDLAVFTEQFYRNMEINEPRITQLIEGIKLLNLSSEKIVLTVIKFIHENIRYLSDNRVTNSCIPADINVVVKRSYGDCKDFVCLASHLLSIFGVESYPVLVDTRLGRGLEQFLPSPNLFNHAIILIKIEDKNYFVDPTIRQFVDSLKDTYFPDFGYGLICNKNTHKLERIRNKFTCKSHTTVSDEYQVISIPENKFIFKSRVIMRGLAALKFKRYLEDELESKVWESFRNFYSQFMFIKEVNHCEVDYSKISENVISYSIQYQVSTEISLTKRKNYFLNFFPVDLIEKFNHKIPPKVESDFYFGFLESMSYKIDIVANKFKFSTPAEYIVRDEAFLFERKTLCEKYRVSYYFFYSKNQEVVPQEKYQEFYQAFMKVRAGFQAQLILRKKYRFSMSFILGGFVWLIIMLWSIGSLLKPISSDSQKPTVTRSSEVHKKSESDNESYVQIPSANPEIHDSKKGSASHFDPVHIPRDIERGDY